MIRIHRLHVLNAQHEDRGRPKDGLPSPSLAAPPEGQKGRAGRDLIQESGTRRDLSVLTHSPRPWCNCTRETHKGATRR